MLPGDFSARRCLCLWSSVEEGIRMAGRGMEAAIHENRCGEHAYGKGEQRKWQRRCPGLLWTSIYIICGPWFSIAFRIRRNLMPAKQGHAGYRFTLIWRLKCVLMIFRHPAGIIARHLDAWFCCLIRGHLKDTLAVGVLWFTTAQIKQGTALGMCWTKDSPDAVWI